MSLVLAGLGVACGDQPTEVDVSRSGEENEAEVGDDGNAATSSSDDGLSIKPTDKDDYQPGDTVSVVSGWAANDVLDILLKDEPRPTTPQQLDGGWARAMAGRSGIPRYVVDNGDLDVTFTLVRHEQDHGAEPYCVVFTDNILRVACLYC